MNIAFNTIFYIIVGFSIIILSVSLLGFLFLVILVEFYDLIQVIKSKVKKEKK